MRLDHTLYSAALDINYQRIRIHHLNRSTRAVDLSGNCSEFPPDASLDVASCIYGGGSQPSHQMLDSENTPDASNGLVTLANNGQMTLMECGNYQDINTGNGLDRNGRFQASNRSEKCNLIQMNQPPMNTDFGTQLWSAECLNPSLQSENVHAPSMDINYNQNNSYDVNAPSQDWALNWDFLQEQSGTSLDFAPNIHGGSQNHQILDHNNTPIASDALVALANSTQMTVMEPQFPQNMNTDNGPCVQLPSFNEPLKNVVSQQHYDVASISSQVDPAGISVGASKQQILEYNHEIPGTANSLASLADETKKAGPEPQPDQHEDKSSNGSGTIPLTVPQFVVEIPKSTPFDCWKGEILKKMEVVIDSVLHNIWINISITGNVTIRKKRAIRRPCQQQRRRQRRFSLDETKFLIDAVDKHRIGGWQEIKEEFFHTSDRTCNDLKDKWRSLVKTANTPAANRRGPLVPQDLLDKVICIVRRNADLQGKPLQPQDGTSGDC